MKNKRVRLNSRVFWTSIVLGTLLSSSAFAADTQLTSMSDLSSYVKNPKFKLSDDELRLVGLVPVGCSIKLSKDSQSTGIQIALSGCEKDAANSCTTDTCTDLGDSKNKVSLNIASLPSGKIQFTHEDKSFSVDDEGRFQHEDILGGLEFKNKADRDAEKAELAAKKRTGQIDELYDKVMVGCKSKDLEEVLTAESALKSLLDIGALVNGKTTYKALSKDLKAQEEKAMLADLKKRTEKAKFTDEDDVSKLKEDLSDFNNRHEGHTDEIADLYSSLVEKRLESLEASNLSSISQTYGDIENIYKDYALVLDGLSKDKRSELQARAEALELQRSYYLGMGKASAIDPSVKAQWETAFNTQNARIQASINACTGLPAMALPIPPALMNCSTTSMLQTGLSSMTQTIQAKQDATDKYLKQLKEESSKSGTPAPATYDPSNFKITGSNSNISTTPGYGLSGNNFSGVPTSNLWYGGNRYGG